MNNRVNSNGDLILWVAACGVLIASVVYPATPLNDEVLCVWRRLFNVTCFGCGLTRSFIAISSGHMVEAVRQHPVGPFLYLAVIWCAAVVPIRRWVPNGSLVRIPPAATRAYWVVAGIVFVGHSLRVVIGWLN